MADVDQKLTDLIGFSREAFDTAQTAQGWSSRLQWVLAVIAVVAVFLPGQELAIVAAGLSLVGAAAIACLRFRQQGFRRYGERVRRATLLAKGLGHELSAHEYQSIEATFGGDRKRATAKADTNYYASRLPPGEDRLIENLYESAFWSADLFKYSARTAWVRFAGLAFAAILVIVTIVPFLSEDLDIILSRIFLVVMTVLVSREVLGDAFNYSMAQHEVCLVLERLEALKGKPNKTADLMLILGDYNAAVEAAPIPQTGVYERRKQNITDSWDKART
ncbi:hypothetical protein PB2503_00617 [Parvularcula bermudensis HTCC2503]|uniref:Uncharacterized protein n=1 Tax=Parvularcula bermudensis (strain ATCC BAA-594 / HTCC2503 / KCTC 12087) TaxID=314260 RepID=E0TAZ5_PARBH|nr:hypothetical protein [Parvularcula bermudensis]ADM08204.1 hypothetical protein PB2503_00617 [Parvularcula bermudensis HTCC2503]